LIQQTTSKRVRYNEQTNSTNSTNSTKKMRLLDFFKKLGAAATSENAASAQETPAAVPGVRAQNGVIKSVWLHFLDQKSDKVYHLQLRASGNGYTVHFEYGRRGQTLQSGTKTEQPVSLEAAENIFNTLLNEKTKKGYQYAAEPTEKSRRSYGKKNLKARNNAILAHLQLAVKSPEEQATRNWKLSRVVWRAGVLALPEALPALVQLLPFAQSNNEPMLRYALWWAIARCGKTATDEQQRAVKTPLTQWMSAAGTVQPFEYAALALFFAPHERTAWREALVDRLPPSFQHQIQQQQADNLRLTLQDYVENRPKSNFSFVEILYVLSLELPAVRPAVRWFVENAPFRPGTFVVLRSVYKMAEMRLDAEVFGVFARRFGGEKGAFSSGRTERYMAIDGVYNYVNPRTEMAEPNARLAYSTQTRNWLVRRTLQTLLETLEQPDDTFVKMAVGILLAFDDNVHKSQPVQVLKYQYNSKTYQYESYVETVFPAFGEYPTFFYLLNGENTIFRLVKNNTNWTSKGTDYDQFYRQKTIRHYEPHLDRWNKTPQAFIHLMAASRSAAVQEFALRHFRQHPECEALVARFDLPLLTRLLASHYAPTASFALEILEKRFEKSGFDHHIILQMLDMPLPVVQTRALEWMQQHLSAFVRDTTLVFRLLVNASPEVRAYARSIKPQIIAALDATQLQVLFGKLILQLLQYTPKNAATPEQNLATPAEILDILDGWSEALEAQLSNDTVAALLRHQLEPVQEKGLYILSNFPPDTLEDRRALLLDQLNNRHDAVRWGVQTIILKHLNDAPTWGETVLKHCIHLLLTREQTAGIHEEKRLFVVNYLKTYLPSIDRKTVFKLLNAHYIPANMLAAQLVEEQLTASTLSVRNIVRLAEHEVLAVRQVAQRMFAENIARMQYEREDALRLLESPWDDVRAFAFDYFRTHFTAREWTPETMIQVMDSLRPDVQEFGKTIVEQYLQPDDGPAFLQQLCQHPRVEVQAFAAQFLATYAADKPEYLAQLSHYCTTVLMQVNKARTARNLVFDFLKKEALKTPVSAQIVQNMLENLVLTSVVEDKNKYLELLYQLRTTTVE
jgi:predicted DNA-binding WGR domain protein